MDDEEASCPLCMEDLDVTDRNFRPCPCGYQVCLWCYHHIKENLSGQCPACRRPYEDAKITADPQEIAKLAVEKKQKDKQEKRQRKETTDARPRPAPLTREQLQNVRVIQRTLVYVVGLSPRVAKEDTLRRPEFFGQYGRIVKVAVNTAQAYNASSAYGQSLSCYITYSHKDEALNAILASDGVVLDGRTLRAQFGTTKYCALYIRQNTACTNPECMFLHEIGEMADTYTKEEMVGNGNRFHNETHPATSHKALAVHAANGGQRAVHVKYLPPAPQALLDAFGVPNTSARGSGGQRSAATGTAAPAAPVSAQSSAASTVSSPPQGPQLSQIQGSQLLQLLQRPPQQQQQDPLLQLHQQGLQQQGATAHQTGVPGRPPVHVHQGDAGTPGKLWYRADAKTPALANGSKAAAIGPPPSIAPGKAAVGTIGSGASSSATPGLLNSGPAPPAVSNGLGHIIGAVGEKEGVGIGKDEGRQGVRTAARPRLRMHSLDDAMRSAVEALLAAEPRSFPTTTKGVPPTSLVVYSVRAMAAITGGLPSLLVGVASTSMELLAREDFWVRSLKELMGFDELEQENVQGEDVSKVPPESVAYLARLGSRGLVAGARESPGMRPRSDWGAGGSGLLGTAATSGAGGVQEEEWHRNFRALLPNVNVSFPHSHQIHLPAPPPAAQSEPPLSAHDSVAALWQSGSGNTPPLSGAAPTEAELIALGLGTRQNEGEVETATGSRGSRWWS